MNTTHTDPIRVAHRRGLRGRTGSLQELPFMPLDILFEIFGHMDPSDLLHLARSTKAFRALLMSRSSAMFWKAARSNIKDLPDRPWDMSEPEFADLLFDSHCQKCLKPNVKYVIWEFRARYCPNCKVNMSIEARSVELPGYSHAIQEVLSSWDKPAGRTVKRMVHVPEFLALKYAWLDVGTGEHKQNELIDKYKVQVFERKEFTRKCTQWLIDKKETRSAELGMIRRARLEAIVQKLRDLGWGEELDRISDGGYYRLSRQLAVRQNQALSDRAWNRIQPELVAYMEAQKHIERQRLLRIRFGVMQDAIWSFQREFDRIFPNACDFALFPEVRALVDAPNNVSITTQSFNSLRPGLPDLIARWKGEKDATLQDIVRSKIHIPPGTDATTLAVNVSYRCSRCNEQVLYPNVLVHHCCGVSEPTADSDHIDEYERMMRCMGFPSRWQGTYLEAQIQTIEKIIRACGQNPTQVTQSTMDQIPNRVTCGMGCVSLTCRAIMTWRAAIQHAYEVHANISEFEEFSWSPVSPDDAATAIILERNALENSLEKLCSSALWHCALCPPTPSAKKEYSQATATDHLKTSHLIGQPRPGDLFYDPNDPKARFDNRPVYLISFLATQTEIETTPGVLQALERNEAMFCELSF